MILSTLDKSRKGGAYEQIPSLVLGQRWTPQLNSRNMMKVVLCVWIEPYIENDLSFCVWPVHTPTTSKEVLTLSASTSPLPYTGNKSCIVNTILSVMPKHTVYIDPCMGSAKVFFRMPAFPTCPVGKCQKTAPSRCRPLSFLHFGSMWSEVSKDWKGTFLWHPPRC